MKICISLCSILHIFLELLVVKPTLLGSRARNVNKGYWVPVVRFCFRWVISVNFFRAPTGNAELPLLLSSSFMTDQLVWGWHLKALQGGEECWIRLQRSSVQAWKRGPSVVNQVLKSAHPPVSGRVWSFGYSFSQAKHVNKSLLLGENVSHRHSNKGWSLKTQLPVITFLLKAHPPNSPSSLLISALASLLHYPNMRISFSSYLEYSSIYF